MVMHASKKIVLLGHFGVGKTSLIRRFVSNSFSDNYKVSIGAHITKKVVDLTPDQSVTLIIWDLEGTDDLKMVRQSFLMGTHGVLYVFDVSRPSTFQNISGDLMIIEERLSKTPIVIVGNKMDLVKSQELELIFQKNSIPFDFLTSAKTGSEVPDAFRKLASFII